MHARRASLILATQGVGAVVGLVGLFFVGRFMGPTSYGTFGFAMGYVGLWMVFADMGLDLAHVRFISRGEPAGDCIATHRMLKMAIVIFIAAGASAAVYAWNRSDLFTDASALPVLVAVLLYTLFVVLRTIPVATLNAFKLTASTQMMVLVEHAVKLPLVIFAALFYGFMRDEQVPFPEVAQWIADHSPFHRPMESAEGGLLLGVAWALAMLGSLIFGMILLGRQSLPHGRFDLGLARAYLVFAFPLALSTATKILFTNIDAVFIGYFLSAENVGYYFAAERLTALALVIPMALSVVFFPIFGELATRGEIPVLNVLAANLQRVLSIIMILIVTFFTVFPAEGIIISMGEPFLPARLVLPWLAFHMLLLSTATIASTVAIALGSPYLVVRAGVAALVVNIILDILLIPDAIQGVRLVGFHSVGAAVATIVAQAVGLSILVVGTRRLTGRAYLPSTAPKHIAAGLVTGVVLFALKPLLFGAQVRVWELAFAGLVGTVLYLLLLVLWRELTRADLMTISEALHPGRMVAYIREETRDKRLR